MTAPSPVHVDVLPAQEAEAAAALAQAEGLISVEASWLEAHCRASPDLCLAAWREQRLVGISVASDFGAYAFLGPLAVAADEQGRGIGGLLLGRTLESLPETSTHALEATDAGRLLYERRGFVGEWTTVRLRAEDPTPGAAERPVSVGDFDALLRIDREHIGGDRELALRMAASLYGLEPLTYGDAAALAGPGRIGPLVAGSSENAEAVLDAACRRGGPLACWTREAPEVISMLERRGFERVEAAPRLLRMGLGPQPGHGAALYLLLSLQAG